MPVGCDPPMIELTVTMDAVAEQAVIVSHVVIKVWVLVPNATSVTRQLPIIEALQELADDEGIDEAEGWGSEFGGSESPLSGKAAGGGIVSNATHAGILPSTLGTNISQAAFTRPLTAVLAWWNAAPKRPPPCGLGSLPQGSSPSLTLANETSVSSSSSSSSSLSGLGFFILMVGYAVRSVSCGSSILSTVKVLSMLLDIVNEGNTGGVGNGKADVPEDGPGNVAGAIMEVGPELGGVTAVLDKAIDELTDIVLEMPEITDPGMFAVLFTVPDPKISEELPSGNG